MFCPVDGKACPDDLCHGGGCIRTEHNEPMLELCETCGQVFPEDELFDGICEQCREDGDETLDDEA